MSRSPVLSPSRNLPQAELSIDSVSLPAVPASSAQLSASPLGVVGLRDNVGMVGGMSPAALERMKTSAFLTQDMRQALSGPSMPPASGPAPTREPIAQTASSLSQSVGPSAAQAGSSLAAPLNTPINTPINRVINMPINMHGVAPLSQGPQLSSGQGSSAHGASAQAASGLGVSGKGGGDRGSATDAIAPAAGEGAGALFPQIKGNSPIAAVIGKLANMVLGFVGLSLPRR